MNGADEGVAATEAATGSADDTAETDESRGNDGDVGAGGADGGGASGEGRFSRPPDRAARGLGVVTLTALTSLLVLATSRVPARPGALPTFLETLSVASVVPIVPPFVYVYALLGGLGYVFTRMYKTDTADWRLFQWSVRLIAALPVAVGTYLFVGLVLPETVLEGATDASASGGIASDGPRRVVAGVAFVSGLFVDTAYDRLDAVARRLLTSGSGSDDDDTDDDTDGGGDTDDTDDESRTPTDDTDDGEAADTTDGAGGDGGDDDGGGTADETTDADGRG
ncbi:hypothetical protein [Halobaculum sp. MBLA0143]|uniref:hypothetical protein n=1 Tax=Halobaculum sp. MBLA0143 TaxID=3079933 RepID=UPI0035260A12